MRIGLCACYDTYNYGSQLQSYASLITLQEMGYDVKIIKYKKKLSISFIFKSIPRIFNLSFVRRRIKIYHNKLLMRTNKLYSQVISNRNKQFDRFIRENFKKYVVESYGYHQLKNDAKNYQAIVVGSDQLWLPSGMASNFYNLLFVPDEIKKVSFSTSFGVSNIPEYQKRKTKFYLERFSSIGVREDAGKTIVEELTNKKAVVTIDPTMMLDADKWDEKIGSRIIKDKYIFCYFLGSNSQYREKVKEFAEKNNIKVINLAYVDQYVESDNYFNNIENIGPFEFVNLVKNAEYIFTDSFHGSVFSVVYQKQFIVFNRFNDRDNNSRNSRIDNLTKMLGLEDRRYNGNIEDVFKTIDYESVLNQLELERRKTREFLKNALSC